MSYTYSFWCNKITDESVKMLGNCHTLDLFGCEQITNDLIEKLRNTVTNLSR